MFDTFGYNLERIEDMFTTVKEDFVDYKNIIFKCDTLIDDCISYLFSNIHTTLRSKEEHIKLLQYETACPYCIKKGNSMEQCILIYKGLRGLFDGHLWLSNDVSAYMQKSQSIKMKFDNQVEIDDFEIEADDMLYFTRKIIYGLNFQEQRIEDSGLSIKDYIVFSTIKNQYEKLNYKDVLHDANILLPLLIEQFAKKIYNFQVIEEKWKILDIIYEEKQKQSLHAIIEKWLQPFLLIKLNSAIGFDNELFYNAIRHLAVQNKSLTIEQIQANAQNTVHIIDMLVGFLKNSKFENAFEYIEYTKNVFLNANYKYEMNDKITLKKAAKDYRISQKKAILYNKKVQEIILENKSVFQTFQKVSDLPEELKKRKKVANLFSYARMKMNDQKFSSAIEDYNDIISITPNEAFYYVFRAVSYEFLGMVDQADKDYNKALSINNSKDFYYYNRGLARSEAGDYKGAILEFDRAIDSDNGNDADFYYYRGKAKESLCLYEEALLDYNEAELLNPKHSGIKYRKEKVNEKKLEHTNQILNSRNITNLFKYACAKLRDHDFLKAIEDFDSIIQITGKRAFYYIYRGVAKEYLGINCKDDYETAMRINPKKDFFHYNKGLAKHEALDFLSAIKEFNIAIKQSPHEATYYYHRAISKEKAHLTNEAVSDYKKVLKIEPNHSEAPRNLEKITKTQVQYKEEFVDSMSQVHHFSFTISKFEHEAYSEAIEDLDRFIAANPKAAFYYIYRGVAKELLGHKMEARKDFTIAKSINSKKDFFYYNYGLAYFRAGKFAEAISAIDKAIDCNKGSFNYHFYNGLINEKSGHLQKAVTYYRYAVELSPNHKEALRRMKRLIVLIEEENKRVKTEKNLSNDRLLRNTKSHEYFENARYFLSIKEYDNAIVNLSKAIKLQNKIPFYHIYRGVTYGKLELTEAMDDDFDTAIRLNSDMSMFHFNKSKAEFDIGDYALAFKEIGDAIAREERFVFFNYRMRLNRQLGKFEEALSDSRKAKELEEKEKGSLS